MRNVFWVFLAVGFLAVTASCAPATLTVLYTSPCNDSTAVVGDADCGQCLEYDLRVATDSMQLINNWNGCTRIAVGIPSVPGQDDSTKILSHVKNAYRFYAIKASNGRRWSVMSNILTVYIETTPAKPAARQRITW